MDKDIVKFSDVEKAVFELRGQKVILDSEVAKLYGVETMRVNEAVKNNPDKFPQGYIFELTKIFPGIAQSLHRKRLIHACYHPEKPQGHADHHRHCGDFRQNPGTVAHCGRAFQHQGQVQAKKPHAAWRRHLGRFELCRAETETHRETEK